MKCHYEVLDIPRNATDDEIKKSYRKLALKWHPDKNPDQTDECTREFHLVQQAYEVLIDAQERAWYDKHREAILKGGQGHGDKYEDNCLDVYQYFNTACYTGFSDDENGFYTVYKIVFETITTEDLEYMDDQEANIPGFGNSKSEYEEVVGPFYAYWEGYCTARSYVWEEKYDTREAPHRQVRRAMEQENKKLRDKAKKERNEEVRALVAFVRKRDKRVAAYKKKLEERAAEISRRTDEKMKRMKEEKLKEFENYKEADWSAMDGLEKDLAKLDLEHAKNFDDVDDLSCDGSSHDDEMEDEEEEEPIFDELYCVACNKLFKTQKAFDNHENSKKHKQNVDLLKVEMENEEDVCGEDTDHLEDSGADNIEDVVDSDVMYDELYCQFCDQVFTDDLALYNHTTSKKHKDNVESLTDPKPDPPDDDVTEQGDILGQETQHTIEENEENTENEENLNKQSKKPKKKPQQNQSKPVNLNCNICNEQFETRNKLFQHIKESNHALRVPEAAESVPSPQSSKTKKNKKKKKK